MLTIEHKQRFIQRSRMEIIASLLKYSIDGSRKTRLIYKCNLSLSLFNKYVDCLIEGELLQKNTEMNPRQRSIETYHTTEKGMEFLRDYEKISKILNEIC